MRAAYHLAFIVFSLGTVATPSTAPNATDQEASRAPSEQQHAIMDAAHKVTADLSASSPANQESPSASWIERGTSLGETLPDDIELYPIPKHETYRYAVVNHHRVIVDAASRKVVYIVP
jgi:Protein of unknown function (DUF1236)